MDKQRYSGKGLPYTHCPVLIFLSKHLLLAAATDETGLHEPLDSAGITVITFLHLIKWDAVFLQN